MHTSDIWESPEARQHRLRKIERPNPYGLEIVEQESMIRYHWYSDLKNRLRFMLKPFWGAGMDEARGNLQISTDFQHVQRRTPPDAGSFTATRAGSVMEVGCGWGKNLKLIYRITFPLRQTGGRSRYLQKRCSNSAARCSRAKMWCVWSARLARSRSLGSRNGSSSLIHFFTVIRKN